MSQLFEESNEWQGTPVSIEYSESANAGTPYYAVGFDVGGHVKYVKLWMTEKAMDRSMRLLKDLGFNGDFEKPALSRTDPVKLSCKHEEYNGKMKEAWSYWGENTATPIDKTKASTYAAHFKNAVAASKPVTRPTTPLPKVVPLAPKAPAPTGAPKPQAPAPTPAKDEETPVATTEDEAWAFWCEKVPTEEARNSGWLDIVAKVKPKTKEDWHRVAISAITPF